MPEINNLQPSTPGALAEDLNKVFKEQSEKGKLKKFETIKTGMGDIVQCVETQEHKDFRMQVMKTALKHPMILKKGVMGTSSNVYGYDLRAPALLQLPWLTPLRESISRVARPNPGVTAHWKKIVPSSFTRGGMPACGWINQGQRAPLQGITALDASASYVSLGVDGSVTYEEESASQGFEDALALSNFIALENLQTKEEDAIIGGNRTLALGTANTPTGTSTGTGSFSGSFYCAVVGLTYEGYRNTSMLDAITNGITQQVSITTPDGKAMQVNGGMGRGSAISSVNTLSSKVSGTFTVVPKNGEIAWAWYVGTSNSAGALYLQEITTVPSFTFTATPITTTQLYSALTAADFSVNDGTTGGGGNQVVAFDGFLTQSIINAETNNAYIQQFAGATLTANGSGGVTEIDNMLESLWSDFKVTVDVIWVNAQELRNITRATISTASGPLLRFDKDANSGQYELTASGTISAYYNPYIPGGRKITIMVHPTLPPGTMLAYARNLPSYFKSNATPNVAEMLTRRDYYSVNWADVTREYQFGVYTEEVLAIYAPFCLGVLTGIANGVGGLN